MTQTSKPTVTKMAKTIEAELKATFPGVAFSAKKVSYSTIYVEWQGGPSKFDVQDMLQKHPVFISCGRSI